MRGFTDAAGRLPAPSRVSYVSADAVCPRDMVHVLGQRCPIPEQRCLRWLPRKSVGEKIACAEFKPSSRCKGTRAKLEFCIDEHEYTPEGYSLPLTHVSYIEARELCRGMGKRLCYEREWEFACEGEAGLPYPYGHVRDGRRCNHDFPEPELVTRSGAFVDRRVAADALPDCSSPFGVKNLVGNVDEWTTREDMDEGGRAVLRGGWWLIGRNRCRAATANHGETYAGMQTGFRCCADARR